MRVDGTFSERFELHKFPIDQQDLTVSLEIKCALEGPAPARITVSADVSTGIDVERFDMNNVWDLSHHVYLEAADSGETVTRRLHDGYTTVTRKSHSG